MPNYKVNHNYRSDRGGFSEGDQVDLDERDAAWFNFDSPGLLTATDSAAEPETPQVTEPEPVVEVLDDEPTVEVDEKPKRQSRKRDEG